MTTLLIRRSIKEWQPGNPWKPSSRVPGQWESSSSGIKIILPNKLKSINITLLLTYDFVPELELRVPRALHSKSFFNIQYPTRNIQCPIFARRTFLNLIIGCSVLDIGYYSRILIEKISFKSRFPIAAGGGRFWLLATLRGKSGLRRAESPSVMLGIPWTICHGKESATENIPP